MKEAETPTRPSLLLALREPADEVAWQAFARIYTPLIFGFCRRRGLQEADAADVTQDVLRAVALAIRRFEYDPRRGTFRAWLHAVVRSKLAGFLDRRRRNPADPGQAAPLDDAAEARPAPPEDAPDGWDQEYRRHLFQWAAGEVRREVRPGTWDAFWQTAVEERPAAEVAARLRLSVGAVYVARSRVTARLHELIASVSDEDEPPVASGAVSP